VKLFRHLFSLFFLQMSGNNKKGLNRVQSEKSSKQSLFAKIRGKKPPSLDNLIDPETTNISDFKAFLRQVDNKNQVAQNRQTIVPTETIPSDTTDTAPSSSSHFSSFSDFIPVDFASNTSSNKSFTKSLASYPVRKSPSPVLPLNDGRSVNNSGPETEKKNPNEKKLDTVYLNTDQVLEEVKLIQKSKEQNEKKSYPFKPFDGTWFKSWERRSYDQTSTSCVLALTNVLSTVPIGPFSVETR
jgi:hypothetical protein